MEKFYPKNFVMWRPQLLLFLIFLEAIYVSSGSGVNATYTTGTYKSHCESDDHCQSGFECDLEVKECACRNDFRTARFNPGAKFAVFYDERREKCVSPIGRVCTFKQDELGSLDCVPYAHCQPHQSNRIPKMFGVCACDGGYEENEEHLCIPVAIIQDPSGRPMFQESLIGTKPGVAEEASGNQETAIDSEGNTASKVVPPILKDSPDYNVHIKGKDKLVKNWSNVDYSGVSIPPESKRLVFVIIVCTLIVGNFLAP